MSEGNLCGQSASLMSKVCSGKCYIFQEKITSQTNRCLQVVAFPWDSFKSPAENTLQNKFKIFEKPLREYLNHSGTKIRVFRVCFWAPLLPPFFPHSSLGFPPLSPSGLSPLHLPLYSPLFDSRKALILVPLWFRYSLTSRGWSDLMLLSLALRG